MFAVTIHLDFALPPGLERLLGQSGEYVAAGALALTAIVLLACYLLFSRGNSVPMRTAGLALLATMLIGAVMSYQQAAAPAKSPATPPAPAPPIPEPPSPRRPLLPLRPRVDAIAFAASALSAGPFRALKCGGPVGPDGKTEVACDLPRDVRLKNTGGMGPRGPGSGSGLCVFTSIEHSGRWANERRLIGFQQKMTHEPGGGYPKKVDAMLKKHAPGVDYLQYEGGDPAFLVAALASGRMPAVTYNGRDPHYKGSIAHMVNLVAYDTVANLAAVLDNNFVGENELVWMSCPEFLTRWRGNGGGWAVVLLNPPPPPVPTNR